MKKILLLMLTLGILSACDLEKDKEQCTDLPIAVKSSSIFGVKVLDKGSARVDGINVKFETWKEHCNGSIGTILPNGATGVTENGVFSILTYFEYKYTTEEDKVHFKFTLSKNGEIIDIGDWVYDSEHLPPREYTAVFYIDNKWNK